MSAFARDPEIIKADLEAARLRRQSARVARDRKQADAARALADADCYQRAVNNATASLDGLLGELSTALLEEAVERIVGPLNEPATQ